MALTVPRNRRLIVPAKIESTYGTDVLAGAYAAGDVLRCFNITPTLNMEEIVNLATSGDLGRLPSGIGLESGGVSFTMWLRGAGAVYSGSVKPEADIPLQGCGLSSTGSFTGGAEKYTYQPSSTHQSLTLYVAQEFGPTIKLAGCVGNVALSMRSGGVVEARFTFMGLIAGVADITYTAGTIAGTPAYPVLKSAAFQLGTENFAPRIATMDLNLGNQLQRVQSINSVGGLAGYFIVDRDPRLTLDPELATVATYDWFTKWRAGTLADCTFQAGGTQYDRVKFHFNASDAAGLQTVSHSWAAREGLTASPTTMLATIGSGNDDVAIEFN